MPFDSYSALQTSIANWLMRPGDSNITNNAADLITLFESEARRRVRHRLGETTGTFTTVTNVSTVALPSFFGSFREVKLTADPVGVLVFMDPDEMDTQWPITGTTGKPVNYTIVGGNVRFAPVPDAAYAGEWDYTAEITPLSNSTTTNWLLTNHPDLYLFGALTEAEPFIGEDERFPLWKSRRDEVFESVQLADIMARYPAGLQMRTDTGNP